jgi:hypothetical protein
MSGFLSIFFVCFSWTFMSSCLQVVHDNPSFVVPSVWKCMGVWGSSKLSVRRVQLSWNLCSSPNSFRLIILRRMGDTGRTCTMYGPRDLLREYEWLWGNCIISHHIHNDPNASQNIYSQSLNNCYTLKYAYSCLRTEPNIKVGRLAILLRIPHYQAERQLAKVFVSPRWTEVYIALKIRHDCWHKMFI